MACCYPEDCEGYAVTPMLMAPCYPTKCCEDPPMCYPCLPRCPKGQLVYCCEKRPPKTPSRTAPTHDDCDDCCDSHRSHHRERSPPRQRRPRSPPPTRQPSCTTTPDSCPTCCHTTCKPVKTKYVIPCYRYEDGRINNQPTVLMRRACEVATGVRMRRKPFVSSSYCADPYNEVSRYHSEDERGNCCYHFERKKPVCATACCSDHAHLCRPSLSCHPCHSRLPCQPCASSPQCQYVDCVHARVVEPEKSCCYYC